MEVVMVAVVSANGKLTQGDDPDIYKWTSKEDQQFFFDQIERHDLIVMGSGTYESVRNLLRIKKGKLRIVLTKNPAKYEKYQMKGTLEFTSETPGKLVTRLSSHETMLLVGGSKIYSSFMKESLIDEIYLTIEPVVFGSGKNLLADDDFEFKLKLESMERLNSKGTLLLKYKIKNNT